MSHPPRITRHVLSLGLAAGQRSSRRTFLATSALAAAGVVACGRKPAERSVIEVPPSPPDVPVIVLEGPPRERGRIHGESLRAKIHEAYGLWKHELGTDLGSNPDGYIDELVTATSFDAAIERWTPGLMDEVRGLAEGADLDFKTVYAYQLADEDWWYRRNKKLGVRLPAGDKCSALGVIGEDGLPTFVGQNLDLPTYMNGFQALFLIKQDGSDLQSYQFTNAGFIAATGMNSAGIGLCMNTLIRLDPSGDGLPVAFIVRGVLETATFGDAVRFLKTVKHASGQNYTVGGPGAVLALECSANKVVQFAPTGNGSWVCHTNHPIVNPDQAVFKEQVLHTMPAEEVERGMRNTTARYESLYKRLNTPGPKTLDLLRGHAALARRPRKPGMPTRTGGPPGAFTAWSVIYELSGEPKVHFILGPPCLATYRTLRFGEVEL